MNKYRINHIFYSLQGEGYNAGRAAVFVRFAGCNLHCPFCDTKFDTYTEMSTEEIVTTILSVIGSPSNTQPTIDGFPSKKKPLIVLTGGEPTLQADERLVESLHDLFFEVAVESNGTMPPPDNIDHLTLSPKSPQFCLSLGKPYTKELKLVFTSSAETDLFLQRLNTSHDIDKAVFFDELVGCFLQPCDTGDSMRNADIVSDCVDYIKRHPHWRLSLQTHKLIGIE